MPASVGLCNVYEFEVAPEISDQLFAPVVLRCHWYVYVLAPVHVPLVVVSVAGIDVPPDTAGTTEFDGVTALATVSDGEPRLVQVLDALAASSALTRM